MRTSYKHFQVPTVKKQKKKKDIVRFSNNCKVQLCSFMSFSDSENSHNGRFMLGLKMYCEFKCKGAFVIFITWGMICICQKA